METDQPSDPTLCRLAAIAISKHLWKYSHLGKHLESYLDDDNWEEHLPLAVSIAMDDFEVPEPAKEELQFAVGSMGYNICLFLLEIVKSYMCLAPEDSLLKCELIDCMNHVSWTTEGSLDRAETMRSLYFAGVLRENFATREELCDYCLEDCITDLWPKVEDLTQYGEWSLRRGTACRSEFTVILAAYWTARMRDDVENAIDVVFRELPDQFYDEAFSLEENMVINAFLREQYWAVKYFWGLLNEQERVRTITKICENIVSDDPNAQGYKDLFFRERRIKGDLLVFFLQQLSRYGFDDVRAKILGSAFVLLQLLEWPYDNSFMKTLRESWIHHDSIDYGPIVERIFLNVCNCKEYQFVEHDVKYHRIFCRLWEINPQNLKSSIDYKESLSNLWESGNVALLNLMLRDRELKDRRGEFLKELATVYGYSRPRKSFFIKFLGVVFDSAEERTQFCRQIAAVERQ
ncbi:uncharacterized protein LOC107037843 [Diachasma alloeum]|uniref:uncharacterized protein LOC107037843 n=1 Tax=Diachasma alloeum TaxID=454923 RepID=UPI00073830E9|nr:uncharacterized protein LOC107037843 [Diachasma alloeum]